MKEKFLALGDCNLLGANDYTGETYVEMIEKKFNLEAVNCGHTMTTTKEGIIYFDRYKDENFKFLIVAYGLVDSWKTFKYAPYVLYYPDNPMRKFSRKVVKKYKKLARSLGLNKIFGQKNVVSKEEYKKNIEYMVQKTDKAFLVETPPHLGEPFRNKDIKEYNQILRVVAQKYSNVEVVEIYKELENDQSNYFDDVHLNEKGYNLVASKIIGMLS